MSERTRVLIDRRELIVAAVAAAVAYQPLAALAGGAAPPVGASAAPAARLDDWTIDDMWGVHPRPHEAIGYGRPRGDGELLAAVAPVDAAFVA
jgi:hypothetical protein